MVQEGDDLVKDDDVDNGADEDVVRFEWTADDSIDHDRGTLWYAGYLGFFLVLVVLIVLLAHDWFSALVMVVMGIGFLFIISRKPGSKKYGLTDSGVVVNDKFFPYENFRSFSITQEGATALLSLRPLNRFQPGLDSYLEPDNVNKIADFMSDILPYEQHKDPVADLIHRLRL